MKKLLLLSLVLLSLLGCESLSRNEDKISSVADGIGKYSKLADPVTGGWAGIVGGAISTIAATLVAVNRSVVAKQRGDVILEANFSSISPNMEDQVITAASKKIIKKIIS